MFQIGSVGPMLGQAHHFRQYASGDIPYAIDRYTNEAVRLYGAMDRRLSDVEYFAGNECSIVDMTMYPWLIPHKNQGQDIENYPDVTCWYESLGSRAAIRCAREVAKELRCPI